MNQSLVFFLPEKEGMLLRFMSLSHVATATSPALPHFPSRLRKEKWNRSRRFDRNCSNVKLVNGSWCRDGRSCASCRCYSSSALVGDSEVKSMGLENKGDGSWCRDGRNCASCRYYSSSALVGFSEVKSMGLENKEVWVWTENNAVMTAAVERGWNTFLFTRKTRHLALEWSSLALINPLFVEEGCIFDSEKRGIATISHVSTPEEVLKIQSEDGGPAQHLVVDLLDWKVIPAENLVAAFHGSQKTVLAVSRSLGEARVFLEALEHGLGGVVLKAEDVDAVLDLKDYFDRRDQARDLLDLKKGIITQVCAVGMGDRACVDLCCLMKPGEGLLVGSFARGLFLVHSECMESNYISSRPFRVNAGPVHAYIAVPRGRTCYLSELKAGKEVLVVDQKGCQRTAIVGRVKIETRPLLLVEAKLVSDPSTHYSIFLQNAETVALVPPSQGGEEASSLPVTMLKVGDEVVLRTQGGARHSGIEIEEFIVEK